MLLLLVAVEAPAVHLILGAVMEDGAMRGVIRALLLGSSIYVALWFIGDLRWLRETPGVMLGPDVLAIELGLRVQGEVRLEHVTWVRLLAGKDGTPPAGSRPIRITPLPNPNVRVRLAEAACLRGSFGLRLRGDTLDIYVDDPAGLVASIEASLVGRNSPSGSEH